MCVYVGGLSGKKLVPPFIINVSSLVSLTLHSFSPLRSLSPPNSSFSYIPLFPFSFFLSLSHSSSPPNHFRHNSPSPFPRILRPSRLTKRRAEARRKVLEQDIFAQCRLGHWKKVEDLFNGFNTDKIYTPTSTDDHGNTVFSTACKFGHKKIVRKTLKWIGTDMNHLNDKQRSGVELAVMGGSRRGPVVAEYLLSKKCEINMFGRNLLHEACLRGYAKVATLVLARGVNPDEVGNFMILTLLLLSLSLSLCSSLALSFLFFSLSLSSTPSLYLFFSFCLSLCSPLALSFPFSLSLSLLLPRFIFSFLSLALFFFSLCLPRSLCLFLLLNPPTLLPLITCLFLFVLSHLSFPPPANQFVPRWMIATQRLFTRPFALIQRNVFFFLSMRGLIRISRTPTETLLCTLLLLMTALRH